MKVLLLLQKILCFCGNRCVLFDNMTKNQTKKGDQVQELLSLVNMVLEKNGGRPCKEMYTEFKVKLFSLYIYIYPCCF